MKPETPTRDHLRVRIVEWYAAVRNLLARIDDEAADLIDASRDDGSPLFTLIDREALRSMRDATGEADTAVVNAFQSIAAPAKVELPDVLGMAERMRPPKRKARPARKTAAGRT